MSFPIVDVVYNSLDYIKNYRLKEPIVAIANCNLRICISISGTLVLRLLTRGLGAAVLHHPIVMPYQVADIASLNMRHYVHIEFQKHKAIVVHYRDIVLHVMHVRSGLDRKVVADCWERSLWQPI
jgi:hypothetical protein